MEELIIYEKPTCSKCRAALTLLDESGRPYRKVRYFETPLSKAKLLELMGKSDAPAREFVRTKEPAFRRLGRPVDDFSDAELAALLARNPDLIERPILECGDRATIGRPVERAAAFILSS